MAEVKATYTYTLIDNTYYEVVCSNKDTCTQAIIPSEYNDLPVTSIGYAAFENCSSLTSVTIPDRVTSIGNRAFRNCSSLASVSIPNNATSIGDRAFTGCSSLTSITIPDGVTSISEWAFFNCSSLKSATIGDSVTSIDGQAFASCNNLTFIVLRSIYPPTLSSQTIPSTIQKIYVPINSVNLYKAAANWSGFASKIIGISNIRQDFWNYTQAIKTQIKPLLIGYTEEV